MGGGAATGESVSADSDLLESNEMSTPTKTVPALHDERLLGLYDGIPWFKPEMSSPWGIIFGLILGSFAVVTMVFTLASDIGEPNAFLVHDWKIVVIVNIAMLFLASAVTLFHRRHYISVLFRIPFAVDGMSELEEKYVALYWHSNKSLRNNCVKPHNIQEICFIVKEAGRRDLARTVPLMPAELIKNYKQYWNKDQLDKELMPTPEEYEAFFHPPPPTEEDI